MALLIVDQKSLPVYEIKREADIRVPMRDGIRLATDVYRPAVNGAFPAILIRSAYNKKTLTYSLCARVLASHGFAVIVQDIRGRYKSEGEVYLFSHDSKERDYKDGCDTLQWLSSQPWFNGEVGLLGISLSSYSGFTLLEGGAPRGVHLRTMISIAGATNIYEMLYYQGVLKLHWALPWFILLNNTKAQNNLMRYDWDKLFRYLPLTSALEEAGVSGRFGSIWKEVLNRSSYDGFWESMCIDWSRIRVPILHIGGWYDFMLAMTLTAYERLAARIPNQYLIVGPWDHSTIFSLLLRDPRRMLVKRLRPVDFGPEAGIHLLDTIINWFNHWLKGEGKQDPDQYAVQIFTTGKNYWRYEKRWPPQTKELCLYFHSRGRANSADGDGLLSPDPPGDEPCDSYVYDPADPIPTLGGSIWPFGELLNPGPHDQRLLENRSDVLVYNSTPLTDDLEVTGPIKVVLYAASSACNTDFTAKLVDVHPDGYAQILQDGIVRACYRESQRYVKLIEPGQVYRYEIDCGAISHVFRKGHRIRLEISSSNFPKYDRNLNTGHPLGIADTMLLAQQSVYHNNIYPSHLCLPIQQEGGIC